MKMSYKEILEKIVKKEILENINCVYDEIYLNDVDSLWEECGLKNDKQIKEYLDSEVRRRAINYLKGRGV